MSGSSEDSVENLKEQIFERVRKYSRLQFKRAEFVPGVSNIPVAGRVFDEEEVLSLTQSTLEFWLTAGNFASEFEKSFAEFIGTKFCLLTNSGSSANLLAVSALTSPLLKDRRLLPGDEVITTACGFPTTVNPILQNQLIPVFLDVEPKTYQIKTEDLEAALSPRTKAIIIAHTLGNPFQLERVLDFAKKNNLWVIEDNCDAVGSLYQNKKTGSFGDLSTVSFYPAHHMTMGEGGAVLTSHPKLKKIVESFRDWGRDCWCPSGVSNTCGRRFDWKLGSLPDGYDHKYTYSHIGYNLKITDLQAAVGMAQLKKLPEFIEKRKSNFNYLLQGLSDLKSLFDFAEATPHSIPSWFGFPIFVHEDSGFSRDQVLKFLQEHRMDTRLVFAGNLIRQPAYQDQKFRIVGDLKNSDRVMNQSFWLGVYPGLERVHLDYMIETLHKFVKLSQRK